MKNIAILVGGFHKDFAAQMVMVAKATAKKEKLSVKEEIWVPGSMEKPIMAKKLLGRKGIDGLVVLGIIEKGGTKHGFVMATAVISSLIAIQLETMKPMGIGILGPEITPGQIKSRVEPYAVSAVLALSRMLQLV